MASAFPSSTSNFPEPIRLTCAEIFSSGVGNTLEFIRGDYKYIVRVPVGSSINREYIDKISPLLALWELPGAVPGVYTWLLLDFGDESSKQIVVKQNINVTELATKHTDILKDICLNKQRTDERRQASLPLESTIRVYFGGELSKSADARTGRVQYTINFLSGTYSSEQVNSVDFSPAIEEELKQMFRIGICNGDALCPPFDIVIARTTQTLIRANMGSDREFDNSMREYNVAGTSIYRFDKNDRNSSNRASVLAPAKYDVKKDILDRTYERLGKPKDGDDYKRALAKLDAESKPFTQTDLDQFRMRGGGRKSRRPRKTRRSRKSRKSRKLRKSRKSRKSRK
jgi:hypothetical protein